MKLYLYDYVSEEEIAELDVEAVPPANTEIVFKEDDEYWWYVFTTRWHVRGQTLVPQVYLSKRKIPS